MATASGTGTDTKGASQYTLRIDAYESTINNLKNYSEVTLNAYLDSKGYNFYDWVIPLNLYLNGSNVYSASPKVGINKNSSILLASVTKKVPHNNDGSKTVEFGGSISQTGAYYLPGNIKCSENFKLTKIARASQPSIKTYPDNSPNFNIGDTITIHMNRASSSFTHTVIFKYGNKTKEIATNVIDNCTFNTSIIEDEIYDLIPNSNVLKGTIEVTTYNDDTEIGINSCSYNAKVPNTVVPIINSVNFSQTLIEQSIGAYVQSKSKITYNVNANGIKGSSIKSYKVEINGEVHNKSEDTTEFLSIVGVNTCKVTVVDTRGMSTTFSKNFQVLAYTKPKIEEFFCERNESIETQIDFGYTIALSFLNGANRFFLEVFAVDSGTYLPNITAIEDLEKINKVRGHQRSGRDDMYHSSSFFVQMDAESSFDIYCVVIDTFDEVTIKKIEVGTAEELVNFSADGKNVAIGQIYDTNQGGRLQIKGEIVVNGKELFNQISLLTRPIGSYYFSSNSTPPDELFGGTWEKIEKNINIEFIWKRIS